MSQARLLITADDYGMSPLFNRGIEELAREGRITGISVMIKREYIQAQALLKFGIPLGLHLELKAGASPAEAEDQIQEFRKRFGKLPDYLDGHQHKHLLPQNLPQVLRAATAFHLPVRSRYPEDRSLIQENHVPTPENFISWHPTRITVLKERLTLAKQYSISELVVHPGYFDPACNYPYNKERAAELTFLKSPDFSQCIKEFKLISYTALH